MHRIKETHQLNCKPDWIKYWCTRVVYDMPLSANMVMVVLALYPSNSRENDGRRQHESERWRDKFYLHVEINLSWHGRKPFCCSHREREREDRTTGQILSNHATIFSVVLRMSFFTFDFLRD